MNYKDTVEYLYTQLPMFTRIGEKAYNKDLDNIISLCNALDQPFQKFRSIHVAGTNGKGSTSHMLAAILQSAGYKTGLYTSPHLYDFRERIRINGEMINEAFVTDFVQRTRSLPIQPSFFELTAAMAFDYFASEKVDIAVIETGLGGRLDSTNIISPILSVITNIGWDHMYLLGDTLEKISFEKAGIIKKETPVVIGESLPQTATVFSSRANSLQAPITYSEDAYQLQKAKTENGLLGCDYLSTATQKNIFIETEAAGHYQIKNIRTTLTAIDQLIKIGLAISEEAVKKGLMHVKRLTGLRGRWDILGQAPLVIADVAHNRDGITQVLAQLETEHPDSDIHFVLGFVKDKEVVPLLSLFPKNARYYFTNAHIPRAIPCMELKSIAEKVALQGEYYDDINDALKSARKNAKSEDVIMICGSFFTIAELRYQ